MLSTCCHQSLLLYHQKSLGSPWSWGAGSGWRFSAIFPGWMSSLSWSSLSMEKRQNIWWVLSGRLWTRPRYNLNWCFPEWCSGSEDSERECERTEEDETIRVLPGDGRGEGRGVRGGRHHHHPRVPGQEPPREAGLGEGDLQGERLQWSVRGWDRCQSSSR